MTTHEGQVDLTRWEGRDNRIRSIRSWRDQTVDIYGVPHEVDDEAIVANNKAWWSDADALLDALDEQEPIVAAARAWGAAHDEHEAADAEFEGMLAVHGPDHIDLRAADLRCFHTRQLEHRAARALRAALADPEEPPTT